MKIDFNTIFANFTQNTNLASITALISIVTALLTFSNLIIKKTKSIIFLIMKRKLKKFQYKELKFEVDAATKKSLKYYVSTRGQDIDPCNDEEKVNNNSYESEELIPFLMKKNFEKNRNKYYIILADSGMGKTTFLLKLFLSYYKKIFRKYNIKFMPLFKDNIREERYKRENKQDTILLLDGLDENREAIYNYQKFLVKLVNATLEFHTIIISCRTQFFSNELEEPKQMSFYSINTINKKVTFLKKYISPFQDDEIDFYLKKKYNLWFEKNKIARSKKIISNCPKLMVRPLLLAYIDDLLLNTTANYDYIYEIYKELINKWIARETSNDEQAQILFDLSKEIASYMYNQKTIYIKEIIIKKLCKDKNVHQETIDFKSRSLLNRNANGTYKFAHKSILEYFIAEKAFNEKDFGEKVITYGFEGYDMLKLFLNEMSLIFLHKQLEHNHSELRDATFQFLLFPDINLSEIDIIDCTFTGCNLSNAQFYAANFTNVNFSSSNLINANFTRAKFKNTTINNTLLYNSCFQEADFESVRFVNSYLQKACLEGSNLLDVNFKKANLSQASFSYAKINKTNFEKAHLNETVFIFTDFKSASFKNTDFSKAYLFYNFLLPHNIDLFFCLKYKYNWNELPVWALNWDKVVLKDTIFSEMQVFLLEQKIDLHDSLVYLKEENELIEYEKYCKRKK